MGSFLTSNGLNPLHYAFHLGFHNVVNYFTVRCSGAILDLEDPKHDTLLMKYLAAINLPFNLKMASRLIARGADVNYRNGPPFGRTALHQALL